MLLSGKWPDAWILGEFGVAMLWDAAMQHLLPLPNGVESGALSSERKKIYSAIFAVSSAGRLLDYMPIIVGCIIIQNIHLL